MTIFEPGLNLYPLQKIDANGVPIYDFKRSQRAKNTITVNERASASGTPIIDRAGNITDGISYDTVGGHFCASPTAP